MGGPAGAVAAAGAAGHALGQAAQAARAVLAGAGERGVSLAVAESLTGGEVTSTLVSVPGASSVVVGGVVAYATRLKEQLLGVDGALLARSGPVDGEVARQMAAGVARLCGADVGLATTGVAGPGPADGFPAGTVHVAVSAPWGTCSRLLHLDGGRDQVRAEATTAVLALADEVLRQAPPRP